MKRYFVVIMCVLVSGFSLFAKNTRVNNEKQSVNYDPSWSSLNQYDCPEWFKDAKFGIWAHWGPQSVPEQGDWYARFMYGPQESDSLSEWRTKGATAAYAYHLANYGHPSVFGYKDLIPLFKAEKWDPDSLMKLYYNAGARYFMSMGQHHDNFDMWNSKHQPWNSVNLGAQKDIVKGWELAAKKYNMRFGVSFHGFTAWTWLEPSRGADKDGPLKGVPYDGNLTKADGVGKWWEGYDPQDLYCKPHEAGAPRTDEFKSNYIKRMDDLIDNYKPDLIYFDGGIPFDSLKIASDFYNKSQQWNANNQAVINIKGAASDKQKAIVLDIENGQSNDIRKYPWQTDTSLDGWFFRKGYSPASTTQIVQQLVDIVSKNGNLMLNITQRSDGTIADYAVQFLKNMEKWVTINGKAIYGTRPWFKYGEGPVYIQNGEQNSSQRLPYTSQDIRFTTKGDTLYAIGMVWPTRGVVTIKSLATSAIGVKGNITKVSLLGSSETINFSRTDSGLVVRLPLDKPNIINYALKIEGLDLRVSNENEPNTVFSIHFNEAENPLSTLNAGTPAVSWTNVTTGAGIVRTGNLPTGTTNYVLQITNNGGTVGRTYSYGELSGFSKPFQQVLSSNACDISWTFNIRTSRGSTSLGFDTGNNNYGSAVVLCASGSDFLSANGYAVTLTKGTTNNAIRLVKFTNGLSANANISTILGPSAESVTGNMDYYSVRVVYSPSTNTWKLFSRVDGASLLDPESGSLAQVGDETIDNTYTTTPMSYFGYLFNHQTTTNYYACFDNFKVAFTTTMNTGIRTIENAKNVFANTIINGLSVTANQSVLKIFDSVGKVLFNKFIDGTENIYLTSKGLFLISVEDKQGFVSVFKRLIL